MSDQATPLAEFLARKDHPCPSCNYNLRGITGEQCPECNQSLVLGVYATPIQLRTVVLVQWLFGVEVAMSAWICVSAMWNFFRRIGFTSSPAYALYQIANSILSLFMLVYGVLLLRRLHASKSSALDREPSVLRLTSADGRTSGPAPAGDPRLWHYYPEWSPDGRMMAFSVSPAHHDGEDWDLAIVTLGDPSSYRRLTTGPGNDRNPDWRP